MCKLGMAKSDIFPNFIHIHRISATLLSLFANTFSVAEVEVNYVAQPVVTTGTGAT